MFNVREVTDPDECREVWRRTVPPDLVTDLWEFRLCFQRSFRRPMRFLIAEDAEGVCGFLPLSWIEESGCYGYFPGETWEGKTWLEQNRILANREEVLSALLERASPHHLRYLLPVQHLLSQDDVVDEIGYLFVPPYYGYDIENYFQEFSSTSAARIKQDIGRLEALRVGYRYNDVSDFDDMVRLNMSRFEGRSYFADPRFLEGFRSAFSFLRERGWLRVTTVLVRGERAAVDFGCVYRGIYTLLAGGTDGRYPGVAKLINIHHMKCACQERLELVDFLCGDFSWKSLFHLMPRPLYLISSLGSGSGHAEGVKVGGIAHAEQARLGRRHNW